MGLSIRIEVPMREVLLELTRLPVLEVDRLADEDTDGVLVLIDRVILDLALVVGSGAEEEMDGFLVVIELPIRALLLGLSRIIELLLIEVEPVELLLTDTLDEGLRRLEGGDGLETVIRLETEPPGLLLDEIEPGRLGVDLLIDIPVELLRPGTVRLDEIEVERLGVDLLTDILGGLLLRLGADRLDVIVPERLGVGTLAIDDLLELLRLGVDLLTDILLELLRLGIDRLRPAEIEVDRLGVGARLTEGLLRVGAGARLGGAGLAACADWLELLELELFRVLLANRTESATRTSRETHAIKRNTRIPAGRAGKIRDLDLSLYVSMTASFLRRRQILQESFCSMFNRHQEGPE